MAGSTTETIKERLDVVDFLRSYIDLQPAGRNFKGLCPFHKEKTASFMVSPERQSWHCFGCALGGDIFAFLMRFENIEFNEALRILAERTGVEIKSANPAEYKFAGLLFEITDAAKKFFLEKMAGSDAAKTYIASRGLTEKTLEEFEVGWAPNEPEALTKFLLGKKYSPEDIARAGLAFKTERGMYLDRFRGRIMFPIHNHLGKAIGFTGRILPSLDTGEMGKYINSPETPIFNKSKVLYGFWKSKNAIREKGAAFLVEGQMDFLMSYQAGVKYAVASSGTALTADHLRAIRRLADQMIVSFDNDEAGKDAAERAIDMAEEADFRVRVATFAPHKDAADAIQADVARFIGQVEGATPAPEFYFNRYLPGSSFSPADPNFLKQVRTVLAKLIRISSPIDRNYWMHELARRVGVDENVMHDEAGKLEVKPRTITPVSEEPEAPAPRVFPRRALLAQQLLGAALATGDLDMARESEVYLTPDYRTLLEHLSRGERKTADAELDGLMEFVLLRQENLEPQELALVKLHLFEEYVREKRKELTRAVQSAEARGDEEASLAAMRELSELPNLT